MLSHKLWKCVVGRAFIILQIIMKLLDEYSRNHIYEILSLKIHIYILQYKESLTHTTDDGPAPILWLNLQPDNMSAMWAQTVCS